MVFIKVLMIIMRTVISFLISKLICPIQSINCADGVKEKDKNTDESSRHKFKEAISSLAKLQVSIEKQCKLLYL